MYRHNSVGKSEGLRQSAVAVSCVNQFAKYRLRCIVHYILDSMTESPPNPPCAAGREHG